MMPSSTPPLPTEHVLQADARLIPSPPLNPWNPYLRSYGRVYPYSLQYENSPRNWIYPQTAENESSERSLPSYQSRSQLNQSFREFDSTVNSLPLGDTLRQNLTRPRSNRSFHHYRNGIIDMAGAEEYPRHVNLPVIEISSDEEDTRPMPADFFRPSDRHSGHSSFGRHNGNKENILTRSRLDHAVSSPLRRISAELRPNGLQHIKNAYSDENIPSSANRSHTDELAMNLSNRMKRPNRHSLHGSSKHYRLNNDADNRHTPENTNSNSSNGSEPVRKRSNVSENDVNVNTTSAMPSEPIDDSNGEDANVDRKFKIRIKREFKCEPKNNGENESNKNDDAIDTKENLRPIIADVKKE